MKNPPWKKFSTGFGKRLPKYPSLCHHVEPLCRHINRRLPRRWLSRVRITEAVSQFFDYFDCLEMQFRDLRAFIGPREISDKLLHEPRSSLTVCYLGDSEQRKGVTRLHFAVSIGSDRFAHRLDADFAPAIWIRLHEAGTISATINADATVFQTFIKPQTDLIEKQADYSVSQMDPCRSGKKRHSGEIF